jgi:hypothetical protein
MADKLEITGLRATNSAGGLISAVLNTSYLPKTYQLSQIIKCLDNPSSDKILPKEVHKFFKDVKQHAKDTFELPSKMLKAAEKILTAITTKEGQGKYIEFAKPVEKKFAIGSHEIQKSVEKKLNAAIVDIQKDAAKSIHQAISDHVTNDLKPQIASLEISDEIENFARGKWYEIHGGAGKHNFLDAVHIVVRLSNMDDTLDSPAANGAAAGTFLTGRILLSDSVYSHALFCARQEAAQSTAEKDRAAAVQEEEDKKAAALKTAASAAAAARPSPATDQSIKMTVEAQLAKLQKEMASLRGELKKSSGNQSAAGRSQNQQRSHSANQQRQDLGSGGGKGKNGDTQQRPQNAPRAGSGRGGGKRLAQPQPDKTQKGEGHHQRSNSGSSNQRKSSPSPRRTSSPSPSSRAASSNARQGKRRSPSPKSRPDKEPRGDSETRGRQSGEGARGRGGRGQGRGRGHNRTPHVPR